MSINSIRCPLTISILEIYADLHVMRVIQFIVLEFYKGLYLLKFFTAHVTAQHVINNFMAIVIL